MARIVRFHQTGGPEVLKIEQVEVPSPGPGEVRIAVKALGLNRAEAMFRSGKYLSVGEGAALYSGSLELRGRFADLIRALPVPTRIGEFKHVGVTYLRSKLRSRPWWGLVGSRIWALYNRKTEFTDKSPITVARMFSSDLATLRRRLPKLSLWSAGLALGMALLAMAAAAAEPLAVMPPAAAEIVFQGNAGLSAAALRQAAAAELADFERRQGRFLVQAVDGFELLDLEGQDGLEAEGQDAVQIRIVVEEVHALGVDDPGDEAPRVLEAEPGQEGGRSQDVALGPALDDQDPGSERLEMRAVLADPLVAAGPVAPEVRAVVSDHRGY